MGEALFDLEQALRSKRVTPQETSVLLTFKSEAIRDFILGITVGGSVTWFATKRLKTFLRINLTAGSAFFAGMWRFGKSLDSSVDRVLAMEGSRMQSELANIIVDKYRDDSWGMQRISKYFYVEEVYDDSHPDRPKLRWRSRNAFLEKGDLDENTNETHHDKSQRNPDTKQIDPGSGQTQRQTAAVKVDPGLKMIVDPLECVFGYKSEEDQPSTTSSNAPVINSRSHKRAQRRRRIHRRQEASLEARHAKQLSISE